MRSEGNCTGAARALWAIRVHKIPLIQYVTWNSFNVLLQYSRSSDVRQRYRLVYNLSGSVPPRGIGFLSSARQLFERKFSRIDYDFVTGANVSRTGKPGFFRAHQDHCFLSMVSEINQKFFLLFASKPVV